MKSQQAEAAANLPTIEGAIWPLDINTPEKRAHSAAWLAQQIEKGWNIQFCTSDAHSGMLIYTAFRARPPAEKEKPLGMKVS